MEINGENSIYRLRLSNSQSYYGRMLYRTNDERPRGALLHFEDGLQGRSRLLYEAFKIYGADSLKLEVLESGVESNCLDQAEVHYICAFNTLHPNGYNLMRGKEYSAESRRRMSEAQKGQKNHNFGKPLSPERRQKLSEAMRGENHPFYGKTLSVEHRRKMSESHKVKTFSDEHRRKMSESAKRRKRK